MVCSKCGNQLDANGACVVCNSESSAVSVCCTQEQYRVPFGEAVRRFLTKVTSKGRVSRSEFWFAILFAYVLDIGMTAFFGEMAIYRVFSLVMFVMIVYLGWRRIQDIGKSGWWFAVPFYNIYLCTRPSEARENSYGPLPNCTPVKENGKWRKIALAICSLSIISAFIWGVISDDSPEEALIRFSQSLRDKDTEKFLASVSFGEEMDMEKLSANKDMLKMMVEKLFSELESDKKGLRAFLDPEILDVMDVDGDVFVKFAPSDKKTRDSMLNEGISGLMVKMEESDDGWRVCFDQIRPVMADKKEMEEVRAAAERIREKEKTEAAAESVRNAVLKGRSIVVAMLNANIDREARGLCSLFPMHEKSDCLEEGGGDISDRKFKTACEYFGVLFDSKNSASGDWSPYLKGVSLDVLGLGQRSDVRDIFKEHHIHWMIMSGVTSEMSDKMPILISANIEDSYLSFGAGKKDLADDARVLPIGRNASSYSYKFNMPPWWDDSVVVIRKDGSADVIDKSDCTLRRLFGTDQLWLPEPGVKCLH